MRSYETRLEELARNILFGMEMVDKRVDNRPKNVKRELNEDEQRQAIMESNRFFADKKTQEKLERLKYLISDDTNQRKFQDLWGDGMACTPQHVIDSMNARTKIF